MIEDEAVLCDGGASCLDCGLPYTEFGLDLTLPDDQWKMIYPGKDGLLCASCIARRADAVPGAIALRATIDFGKEGK